MLECSFHNGFRRAATNVRSTCGKAWRGDHYFFIGALHGTSEDFIFYLHSSVQMPRNPHKTLCGLSLSSSAVPMRRCLGIAQYWQKRLSWLSNYPVCTSSFAIFSDINSLKASNCTQPVQEYKIAQILKTPAGCYKSKPCECTRWHKMPPLTITQGISFLKLKQLCKCTSILSASTLIDYV
jgi:hypothetical protein